jgi:hypothetical protein
MNNLGFVGIVKGGRLEPLVAETSVAGPLRLTAAAPGNGSSAESLAIDLSQYEGRAIFARGVHSEGWIYAAAVVDEAGPELSRLLARLVGSDRCMVMEIPYD